MPRSVQKPAVLGVLLANGYSRPRGGKDRCLRRLKGRPVLDYIIERTTPQVNQLILNANGDPTRFQQVKVPVVPDAIDERSSTLSGILTGMEWAKDHHPDCEWVASFATSSPFIPVDLISHLNAEVQRKKADMAYVRCGKKQHPEFGIWPVSLAEDLRYAIEEEKVRCVNNWASSYKVIEVQYSDNPIDRFTSANWIEGMIATDADILH